MLLTPLMSEDGTHEKNEAGNFLFFKEETQEVVEIPADQLTYIEMPIEQIKIEEEEMKDKSNEVDTYEIQTRSYTYDQPWSEEETLKLINVYRKIRRKNNFLKKKSLWSIVSKELLAEGVDRNADKCHKKWLNIQRACKIEKNNATIDDIWPEEEIHALKEVVKKLRNKFNKRTELWEAIASELSSMRIIRSPAKCNRKWLQLQKQSYAEMMDVTNKHCEMWPENETLELINTYRLLNKKFKKKKYLWIAISREMASKGMDRTPEKLERKWLNLLKSYKIGIRNQNKTGKPPKRFKFFKHLDEILDGDASCRDEDAVETFENEEELKQSLPVNKKQRSSSIDTPWSNHETLAVIDIYKKYQRSFSNSTSKRSLWVKLSKELKLLGINRSPRKCERKWFNLKKSYRFIVDNGRRTSGIKKFKYFKQMDEILGKKDLEKDYGQIPVNDTPVKSEEKAADDIQESDFWSNRETLALILTYKRFYSGESYSRTEDFWIKLSTELTSFNVFHDSEKCKNKFFNLQRTYYKCILEDNDQQESKFKFFDHMESLMKMVEQKERSLKLCRICLKSDNQDMCNILEYSFTENGPTILEVMGDVGGIEVNLKYTTLPVNICNICLSRLSDAYDLKQQIRESQKTLKLTITESEIEEDNLDELIKEIGDDEPSDIPLNDESLFEKDVNNIEVEMKQETIFQEKDDNGQKRHYCPRCPKSYLSVYQFKMHMREHNNEFPYLCTECGRKFTDPRRFDYHMTTHSSETPYKCHLCPKQYRNFPGLKAHLVTHSENRPYLCNICGKAMRFSTELRHHLRTHTKERPYTCKYCGKTFGYSFGLREHIRVHTGERPFECDMCKKTFMRKTTYERHKRTHARMKILKVDVRKK